MSPAQPRVSVVMPVFNGAGTIADAIDSVLAQSFGGFELIVVDDGSTDDTRGRVAAALDSRISLIRQANAGPSAARNRGRERARGEFLAFIDSDDVWLPDKLARQVDALEADRDAAVVYGWTDFVDDELRFVCADQRAVHTGDVYEKLLRGNFISSGSNVMIRATALAATGGFDESLAGAEDWELNTRLARRFPFVATPEVVVKYRQSTGSLSGHIVRMERHYLRACRKVFEGAPEHLRHLEPRSRAAFFFYLGVRATQLGLGARGYSTASRCFLRAFSSHPFQTLALLRRSNPLAALRLTLRSHRGSGRTREETALDEA